MATRSAAQSSVDVVDGGRTKPSQYDKDINHANRTSRRTRRNRRYASDWAGETRRDQMKMTVFGATGGIGGHVVRQTLAAGHKVTAVVRDPARFDVSHPALEIATTTGLSGARRGALLARANEDHRPAMVNMSFCQQSRCPATAGSRASPFTRPKLRVNTGR